MILCTITSTFWGVKIWRQVANWESLHAEMRWVSGVIDDDVQKMCMHATWHGRRRLIDIAEDNTGERER